MADPARPRSPRTLVRRPGIYVCCGTCGRLLNIQWATRSIVCACGERITPPEKESSPGQGDKADAK